MSTVAIAADRSTHRVTTGWRWAVVLIAPLLITLSVWAILELVRTYLAGVAETQWWALGLILLVLGALTCVFLAAIVWAFRSYVVIDGELMTVQGAFLAVTITRERLAGFRYLNGQLYVNVEGRRWPVQIGAVEDLGTVYRWLQRRTIDLAAQARADEATAIRKDTDLGLTETARNKRLEDLHRQIRRASWLIYASAGIGFANFLFIENAGLQLAAVGALLLAPVFLDLFALNNRGHVHVDIDEGSRYPQILTGTLVAGCALALMSLTDRGALLGDRFYPILLAAVVLKGLIWCAIDSGRLQMLRSRGRIVFSITLGGLFLMPGFWAGGSVYQLNKLLDASSATWHETRIVEKTVSSGRTTSYEVALTPWEPSMIEPVEITLRRHEFEALEEGMRVRVAVRAGALTIPWVAGLCAPGIEYGCFGWGLDEP